MSNRSLARSTLIALTLAIASGTAARAAEPVAVHGVKTVGAMTLETRGLATGPTEVLRQRGFAGPAAARWIDTPVGTAKVSAAGY